MPISFDFITNGQIRLRMTQALEAEVAILSYVVKIKTNKSLTFDLKNVNEFMIDDFYAWSFFCKKNKGK